MRDPADSAPVRILLVEDNPGDARLTRELLAEVGDFRFLLDSVGTLKEAVGQAGSGHFDVVLLDLTLPDGSGPASIAELHRHAPLLPIVVLTGLDNHAVAVEALQSGAEDFLVKGQGDGHLMARALRYAIERKRIRRMLVEAKEAAEIANRAKSEFIANMSHELRTPLNAIIGFAEIIEREIFGSVGNPCYREYAHDIHDSGIHLLNVINDILDLSKIEAGKVELEESELDLPGLVESCLRAVRSRSIETRVTVTNELAAALPRLRADERKVKQILLNLLSNAVKFTPAGGQVRVTADIDAGGLTVRVADTGIGIAAADIARAFTPFQQIDNQFSRRYPGTGLGLSIARSLAEHHDAALHLASTPGVGTTVSICFPRERLCRRQAVG